MRKSKLTLSFKNSNGRKIFNMVNIMNSTNIIRETIMKDEENLNKIIELSPSIVEVASRLNDEFKERKIDMIIGGDMAVSIKTHPKPIWQLDIDVPLISRKEVCDFLSNSIFIDYPINIQSSFIRDKKSSLKPLRINRLRFAPPEHMCFLRMLSNKGDMFYYRDREDVINLLKCVEGLDKGWIKNQLFLKIKDIDKVRELDNLIKLYT